MRKLTLNSPNTSYLRRAPFEWTKRYWPALVGLLAISVPTWRFIATESWSTEQGSLGPFILASGIWLLFRMLPEIRAAQAPAWQAYGAILIMTAALILFRVGAVIELEVYALYGLFLAILFAFIGGRAMKILWFPLFYLVFAVPLPESIVAALTNPLKLWISDTAVTLLHLANYPIASSGVTIQIGQYQLLVAAACAGLSSLITLSALTLFYVYLIHRSNGRYMTMLIAAAVPIAIFSNLVRVLLLILITYHGGEAAAQGFLHNFAGMTTFAIALIMIYGLDKLGQKTIASSLRSPKLA